MICSFLSNISGVFCSCDIEVEEGGEGGVALGDGPLHCISLRQCSARAISAASHSGSSGRMYFSAERRPSIMCCEKIFKLGEMPKTNFPVRRQLPLKLQSKQLSASETARARVWKLDPTSQSRRN